LIRQPRNHPDLVPARRASLVGGTLAAVLVAGAAFVAGSPAGAAPTPTEPLVLYSSQGYAPAVAKAFQQASGIPVELDSNPSGTLVHEIEASKGRPHWGVLLTEGTTTFAGLDQQHLLLRGYRPQVEWNSLGAANEPKDRSYAPTGIVLSEAELYTTKVVTAPPTSWQQLLEPAWKDAVGMDSATGSGTTFPFVAGMMQHLGGNNGVQAGEKYFSKLHHNGLVVRTVNNTVLNELTNGKIKVALVQSTAAVSAMHTHPTLAVRYLAPVTEVPTAVGIDAKASKAEVAESKKFEQFVLSSAGQQVMQTATPGGGSLYYPVVNGVQPMATLPPLSSIKTQRITPYVWGSRQNAIETWFTSHVAQ
jgi:iron(III) transport system substrate-binding protein